MNILYEMIESVSQLQEYYSKYQSTPPEALVEFIRNHDPKTVRVAIIKVVGFITSYEREWCSYGGPAKVFSEGHESAEAVKTLLDEVPEVAQYFIFSDNTLQYRESVAEEERQRLQQHAVTTTITDSYL